jgi:hypothetical protein
MYALILFMVLIVLIAGLWLLILMLYGLPWRPTQDDRIRTALQMADIKPGEIVYDLGSGDGRVLVITISFDLPGWQPEAFDRDRLIFIYIMPPATGSLASFLEY